MDRSSTIKIFLVLSLAILTAMLGVGIIVPILPLYAKTVGASGIWLGAIFAGFSIARAVSMPFVGKLSDHKGRKSFIATGLFLYALSSLGYLYSDSPLSLLLVRIVQGLCSAMIVPIAMAYIGDISPRDKEGSYIGQFNVALFFGFGIGPFLGGLIHDMLGYNADFIVMGLLCTVSCVLVLMYLPSSDGRERAGKRPPAAFRSIIKSPQIQGVMWFRFISSFIRGTVLTFLPLFASDLSLTGFQIGLAVSSGVLRTSFLQYPFGKLADRMNRKTLIIAGSFLYGLGIVLFPLASGFWELLGVNLLSGVLGALPMPAATALMVEEGKKYGMGSLMALFNIAMSLGLGTGPLVSGLIHDIWSLNAVFYFIAFLGIIGTRIIGRLLHPSPPTHPGGGPPRVMEEV